MRISDWSSDVCSSDLSLVERIAPRLSRIREYVMLCDADRHERGSISALCHETLIAGETGDLQWPRFDENAGAVLCYSSGPTGAPKEIGRASRRERVCQYG